MKDEVNVIKLKAIKEAVQGGHYIEAFKTLSDLSAPEHDFTLQSRYAILFESIPPEALKLTKLRLAILASSSVDHFIKILKFWLAKKGFLAQIFSSQFNTIDQTILGQKGPLYEFEPEFVWIFTHYRDVTLSTPFGANLTECDTTTNEAVKKFSGLWDILHKNLSCHILQNNADLPNSRLFGNFEGSVNWSKTNLLRRFNISLASATRPGVTIFDMDYLSSLFGKTLWYDARYWHHSKHAFSLDACGLVASQASALIASGKGNSKKCIVLDLDNTLWGGIIGDDGINGIQLGSGIEGEAFLEFQQYLLALKDRGVLLTICSKNDDDIARDVFLNHPDMPIQLNDIAVFKANWRNKAENIRDIAATLNIGLDSMVFVDDNPVERQLIREFLPEVAVVELPEDPTAFIETIDRGFFFETVVFSHEDSKRSQLYKQNTIRLEHQKKFDSIDEFLYSLEMESEVGSLCDTYLPRFVQLINKSNQFHLTTTRYTESEIQTMIGDDKKILRYFRLKDKFGDNGLVSAVIMEHQEEAFFIDTWVMSCRVLSRGMEEFICNEIITLAKKAQSKIVRGKFIPSKKNKLVVDLYKRLGFELTKKDPNETTYWELKMEGKLPELTHTIKRAKGKAMVQDESR